MIGTLSGIALECPDPRALAAFYRGITGWPVTFDSGDWVSLGPEGALWHLSFQRAPGYQPPTWPDEASSMQFHLHFRVDNPDLAEQMVLAMGAKKLHEQPGSRVYADPAGHPFCLVVSASRAG
jgi:catechol 2,3-dioxygenase-like lactoylglutathione lyase family enzyme